MPRLSSIIRPANHSALPSQGAAAGSSPAVLDPVLRRAPIAVTVSPVVASEDHFQLKTDSWLLDEEADATDRESIFNVLDTMQHVALRNLKKIRKSIWQTARGSCYLHFGKSISSKHRLKVNFANPNVLIELLCTEGKVGVALQLHKHMLQNHVIPSLFTHNHLIKGLCKMNDMTNANWLLMRMSELGVFPNSATFDALIDAYCHSDRVEKALDLVCWMRENGIKPNRRTLNTFVHALCERGFVEDGRVLAEILKEHVATDVVTSTILIDGWCRKGSMVQALELWNRMSRENTEIDHIAYNVLINGFRLSHDMKLAFIYVAEMLKKGFLPDIITFNTLISGLCIEGNLNEGNVYKAADFLQKMLNTSMVPEPLIWNLLINGYGRCGDVKKAYELRDQMAAFGLTPNIFTYNALIHALLKSGNIIDALRLKQKMQMLDDEFSPDVVTYNLYIIGSCHIGKPFVVFNEMRRRGLQPDVITYTVLIQYLCNKGEVKEAEEVFAQMQKAVSFIDHVPYQILIKFYCRIGKLRKAFDLHEIMLEKGLVGRPSMYFYLLSVLKRASVEVVLLLGHHDVFMLPAIFCWKRSQDYYSLENPLWKIRVPFSSVSFTSTQKQHCENDVCFYQKRRECDHQVHCETSKPNNRLIFREGIYSVKSSRRGGPEGAPGAIINWSNCAPNLG